MSDTITVTGNIATPPQYKRTPTGLPITTFRLVSTDRRFDKPTESWVDGDTNWYTVSVFRRMADHAIRSLQKGERVVLTGKLKLREWETEGKKGWAAEIEADSIGHDLLFGTSRFEKDAAPSSSTAPTAPAAPAADGWAPAGDDPAWGNPGSAISGEGVQPDPEDRDVSEERKEPELQLAGEPPF